MNYVLLWYDRPCSFFVQWVNYRWLGDRRRESAMLLQNRNAFGHALIKDIAGNAGDKPLQPTFLDKGGRPRSLLFFTLQPHRPKTRHQKWPSETENRNDAPVARSGTWRLSLIRRMGPICADFGGGKSSSAASAATRRARSNPVSFMSMPSGNMP